MRSTNTTLPGLAGTILARTRDAIAEHAARRHDTRQYFTGGNALIAEWNHRESKDIDYIIRTADPATVREIVQEVGRTIGARVESVERGQVQRLHFDDLPDDYHLDVIVHDLTEQIDERQIVIDNKTERTASVCEILYQKMKCRGYAAPGRDALDIAIARRNAPAELQKAVNAMRRTDVEDMTTAFRLGGYTYKKTMERTVLLTDEARRIAGNLPSEAETAAADARYTKIELAVEPNDGIATITTTCAIGKHTVRIDEPSTIEQVLRRTWIDKAIEARGTSAAAITNELADAMKSRIVWKKRFTEETIRTGQSQEMQHPLGQAPRPVPERPPTKLPAPTKATRGIER